MKNFVIILEILKFIMLNKLSIFDKYGSNYFEITFCQNITRKYNFINYNNGKI